jgi:hypothetical protein
VHHKWSRWPPLQGIQKGNKFANKLAKEDKHTDNMIEESNFEDKLSGEDKSTSNMVDITHKVNMKSGM